MSSWWYLRLTLRRRKPVDLLATSNSRRSHLLGKLWGRYSAGYFAYSVCPGLPCFWPLDLLFTNLPHRRDYMRVISGTGPSAFAFLFAWHEPNFKVPSDCYTTMASHRVVSLTTVERASHARECPRCNGFHGHGSLSSVSGATMSSDRSTIVMLLDHIHMCPCSCYLIQIHDRVLHVLEEIMFEAGAAM
jgi:hypothetical protein